MTRTILVQKGSVIALLGIMTDDDSAVVCHFDPRHDPHIYLKRFLDHDAAELEFHGAYRTTTERGWTPIYDGRPQWG